MGDRLVAAVLALATGCTFVTADPLSSRWQPTSPPVCKVDGGALVFDGAFAFISFVAPIGGNGERPEKDRASEGAMFAAGLLLAAPWIASMWWGISKRRECNAAKQEYANAVSGRP